MHISKISTNSPAFLINLKTVGNTETRTAEQNIQHEAEPAEGADAAQTDPKPHFHAPKESSRNNYGYKNGLLTTYGSAIV